ncbi:Fic family protein [Candidatus Roizmanbacteria bacterium CG06_land_8_20_14_3_00_34_14]|uniref:Fic family protein n=2 Tax=Candidatus Roizmaniibacteriota TaxID=1752723 RepID=A0A2M7AUB4_9BACT|nr:MAG: Fic family protein [Candidatus Roizmanbacteria bacterium CG07_land_8_20_14_0_80_34_15]PIU74186.1 MAG: Fic family protein [Candidatus Roizmanbacteria bacterium CG06_land_8_20_14_3_00_34_14]
MTDIIKFDQRLESLPANILTQIASIDELKGSWSAGVNLHPQVLGRLKQSVLITSTGASTRIEGAKLSDSEVEDLLRGISMQKFKDRDTQEVRGYYELLKNVFDSWQSIKLNEGTIKHFHQEILKYVEKDSFHRGQYKVTENKVQMVDAKGNIIGTIFDTTPVYLTPIEMQELVEWTIKAIKEQKYHPLLIVANFVVEFLKIHPFRDGNGRLSRILTNLLMLQAGYLYMPYVSHEKLVEEKKQEYYVALRKTQITFKSEKADIVPWLTFFLNIIFDQSKQAVELLTADNVEKTLSGKQLTILEYLQEVKEATPGNIAEKTNVARPTVNQVLEKLIKLKKAERIGMGRSTRYRIL